MDLKIVIARAHLSPLHTPVPLAHHTSTKKNEKQFSQRYFQKKIISRINFIQKFPTNYSTKLSRFFLCLLDTMCLVHPHFLTVHLQTAHSIFNLTICLPVILFCLPYVLHTIFQNIHVFFSMSLMLLFLLIQASHTIFPIFIKQISILCGITPFTVSFLHIILYILVIPLSTYIPKWCMKWGY